MKIKIFTTSIYVANIKKALQFLPKCCCCFFLLINVYMYYTCYKVDKSMKVLVRILEYHSNFEVEATPGTSCDRIWENQPVSEKNKFQFYCFVT